jgi:hypothetical protein
MMSETSGNEKYEVVYVYASAGPHFGFLATALARLSPMALELK